MPVTSSLWGLDTKNLVLQYETYYSCTIPVKKLNIPVEVLKYHIIPKIYPLLYFFYLVNF